MRIPSNWLTRITALSIATAWVVFLSCHLLDDVWGHPWSATDDDDQAPTSVLNVSVDATVHPIPLLHLSKTPPPHDFSSVTNPYLQTGRLTEASLSILLGQGLPVRHPPNLLHLFCIYRL